MVRGCSSWRERAILIWSDIQVFIAQICAGPKSKIPKSHSFTSLQEVTQDFLVPAKLQFFCTIAKVLHTFLEVFQRERPVLPFMAEYLYDILCTILGQIHQGECDGESNINDKASKG